MPFSPSSRARITGHDLNRFASNTLFDRIGRAVCEAGCLPRKELYEAWEMGRRVRRVIRGGRVVDVAGGHGMLAQILLLLDDSSPDAVVIDVAVPASATKLHQALVRTWPRLGGRVHFREAPLVNGDVRAGDLVVSCHACGALTDRVIATAVTARARVAVLPCCHDIETCDPGSLTGWIDAALAIDVRRVARLELQGYLVRTQVIPAEITPRNRLIIATPVDDPK